MQIKCGLFMCGGFYNEQIDGWGLLHCKYKIMEIFIKFRMSVN